MSIGNDEHDEEGTRAASAGGVVVNVPTSNITITIEPPIDIIVPAEPIPAITLNALIEFGPAGDDGQLVRAVSLPWFEIVKIINENPESIYDIDWRKWEEIIAGAYEQAGFDEVVLTPRSGDKGRDIIATKNGLGSIRIFEQVKAYGPGHLVTADEVRAMLGVITAGQNVSKGIITTTSEFAPRLKEDNYINSYIPYRLELKPRGELLKWLDQISKSPAGNELFDFKVLRSVG